MKDDIQRKQSLAKSETNSERERSCLLTMNSVSSTHLHSFKNALWKRSASLSSTVKYYRSRITKTPFLNSVGHFARRIANFWNSNHPERNSMAGRLAIQVHTDNILLSFTTKISKADWTTERRRRRMHWLLGEIPDKETEDIPVFPCVSLLWGLLFKLLQFWNGYLVLVGSW